jgi:hypothetical protein
MRNHILIISLVFGVTLSATGAFAEDAQSLQYLSKTFDYVKAMSSSGISQNSGLDPMTSVSLSQSVPDPAVMAATPLSDGKVTAPAAFASVKSDTAVQATERLSQINLGDLNYDARVALESKDALPK